MQDSKRDTDVKNRLLGSVGEHEGGMIWDNSIEACLLSYVKQIAPPSSMHEAGCSGLVHWDDPEGWDGEGGGREGQDKEHMYNHGWFIWMYGKNHHNIVIQFSSVTQSCPTLCDPMNRSTPGLPVHHQLSESTQTHVHLVGDAIQPSHPLSSPPPPALSLSHHQGLFQ